MSPDMTIVVCAYNAQETIGQTMQSLLAQTHPCEIVVVDDGSSDATSSIVRSFRHPRVCLVRQRNQGLACARNTGLGEVRTTMTAFLDADDVLDARFCEVMGKAIGACDGVRCAWRFVDERLEDLGWHTRVCAQDVAPDRLIEVNQVVVGSVVYRTRVLRRASLDARGRVVFDPTLPVMEDWDLLLRLARRGFYWAPPVDDTLFAYRLRTGSMSTDLRQMHETGLRLIERYDEASGSTHAARRRRWCLRSLGRALAYGDAELAGELRRELGRLVEDDLPVLASSMRESIARVETMPPDRVCPDRIERAAEDGLAHLAPTLAALACGQSITKVADLLAGETHRIVLAGMGRNGRRLASALDARGRAYVWLDDAPEAHWHATRIGRQDVEEEDLIVVTPDDPGALASGLRGRVVRLRELCVQEARRTPAGSSS